MESILTSIKKMLGISEEYTHFDEDIINHINTALAILTQLGIGPIKGFRVTGSSEIWDDFISEDDKNFEPVKTYIEKRVKLFFDPPTTTPLIEVTNRAISELEWRLNVTAETIE